MINCLIRNRIAYLNLFLETHIKSKSVGFLVIDDTVNPKPTAKKIEGLDFHFSHAEGKSVWSHCIVTSNFVAGDISILIDYKPYYKKEYCKDINKQFKNKMQLAKELVNSFEKPFNCEKIYVLTDSWYTSNPIIEECLSKGYHLIGAIKSNRKIAPKGIKLQLSQFEKYINPDALDVVTIKGKNYKVYTYEGSVAKIENAIVLICYEVENGNLKAPIYLISTDIELDAKTIIEYYLNRWSIETNYKYLKSNLGFNKYRVRSILSIERYFLIVFLAINFLEIFRLYQKDLMLKTIGETIRYQNSLTAKEIIMFIYYKAQQNVSISEIYRTLKVA
ncbi:Transposase DDE domain-containing protein [Caminicella sporogenes DSM 14501]|uniref:Transposase DDE domain-containing protein n=1 Tax=Caminicella sporogenes DSM 14501 TaxID=1121266 RepID=A0A1M6PID7_9FIRM|nr:IS701 family transposase [Caminicella sporogenes]SHK07670.1 Transposase DDE domain-containing protein [Caminicella sporogenes DSM 14501]